MLQDSSERLSFEATRVLQVEPEQLLAGHHTSMPAQLLMFKISTLRPAGRDRVSSSYVGILTLHDGLTDAFSYDYDATEHIQFLTGTTSEPILGRLTLHGLPRESRFEP